jgi:integrase
MKLSALIRRYLDEVPRMARSKHYTLNKMLGAPIATKDARRLRPADFIDYCRTRIQEGVKPKTTACALSDLDTVLVYARVMWEMHDVSSAALRDAKPILRQQGLIGTSPKRLRRPEDEELARIKAHFAAKRSSIPWADIIDLSVSFGRRISETCRMTWGDYDPVRRTIWIRNLKRSRGQQGNDKQAAVPERANEIIQRQPRLTNSPDERIFKVNANSIVTLYCEAKQELGITGLHLHDNRGECATRLLEQGYSVPQVMLVTLHDDPTTLLRKYNKLRPDNFHAGPAGNRST